MATSKTLTPEQKLDIALAFLTQVNEGSYVYPEAIKLTEHLTSKGISDKEHLPIIFHLKKGEYVDLFYNDEDRRKRQEFPHQIKVTFKGIKFHDKGGYTKLLEKEKRKECVQFIQQILSIPTFIITLITVCFLVFKNPKNTLKIEYPKQDSSAINRIQQTKNASITIDNKDTTSKYRASEVIKKIKFKHNSTTIDPKNKELLKYLADICSSDSLSYVKVFAYTDTIGTEKHNDNLSEKRAMAVHNSLGLSKYEKRNCVYVEWLGESAETYDLHFDSAHAQQNCVDVWIMTRKKLNAVTTK